MQHLEPPGLGTQGHDAHARRVVDEDGTRLHDVRRPLELDDLTPHLGSKLGVEARIVQRDSIYRNLIGATRQIAEMAYEGGPKLDAVLSRAEELILALRSGDQHGDFVHLRRLLEEYLEPPGIDARDIV